MKVSDLEGPTLEYWFMRATGKLNGDDFPECTLAEYIEWGGAGEMFGWAEIGPVIERERITLEANGYSDKWRAACIHKALPDGTHLTQAVGATSLQAVMRCVVASKFGDEVPGAATSDTAFSAHAGTVIESGLKALEILGDPESLRIAGLANAARRQTLETLKLP